MDETPVNTIVVPMDACAPVVKLQRWWRFWSGFRGYRRQGPAKAYREVSVNPTDFYSMEEVCTLSGEYIFSFVQDKCVYTFDVRSLATLMEKEEAPENPYTRAPIAVSVLEKAKNFIRWSRKKGVDTRWAQMEPESPDLRFKLKVTDLFQKIDELNYYTKPDWFLNLTVDNLRCFYVELHDIWFHRAELSAEMRRTIIPPPAHPFKYNINEIVAQRSIDFLRKANMDLIRMFVGAAAERTDRILGAMYVVTVLTLVNRECREMYPWLYESATPGIYSRYQHFTTAGHQHALNTINAIIAEGNFQALFHPNMFMLPLDLSVPPPQLLLPQLLLPGPASQTVQTVQTVQSVPSLNQMLALMDQMPTTGSTNNDAPDSNATSSSSNGPTL